MGVPWFTILGPRPQQLWNSLGVAFASALKKKKTKLKTEWHNYTLEHWAWWKPPCKAGTKYNCYCSWKTLKDVYSVYIFSDLVVYGTGKNMLQNKFYRSLLFVLIYWKYHTGERERLFLYQKKETVISYPHYPHCTFTIELSLETKKKTSSELTNKF